MTRGAGLAAALALVALTAGCSSDASEPAQAPQSARPLLVDDTCADVVVLGLRGSTQSADANLGVGEEVLVSVRAMSARLHRSSAATVRLQGIPYPAESAASDAIYLANVGAGAALTAQAIKQVTTSCPDSRLALVGFSQGANVVHDVAAALPAEVLPRVALVAMIADPHRDPTDAIDSETYGDDAPRAGKLGPGAPLGPTLGRTAIAFCTAGDEVCNWPQGGYAGPLSDVHRHFYEKPAQARSTGTRMAAILLRQGV